jgi:hypothetical protein
MNNNNDLCAAYVTENEIHLNIKLNEDSDEHSLTVEEAAKVMPFLLSKLRERKESL